MQHSRQEVKTGTLGKMEMPSYSSVNNEITFVLQYNELTAGEMIVHIFNGNLSSHASQNSFKVTTPKHNV